MLVALSGPWRVGIVLIGAAFGLGAVIRLALPAERAGDLAVRSRTLDATVLVVLGVALIVLANTSHAGR
jgi:hypothetical protein